MKKGKGAIKPPSYRNKLEARFGAWLEEQTKAGNILWWDYESMRFNLGPKAWYTPDFVALWKDGHVHIYETKGYARRAEIVRLKVAAGKYPFKWFLVESPTAKDPFTFKEMS